MREYLKEDTNHLDINELFLFPIKVINTVNGILGAVWDSSLPGEKYGRGHIGVLFILKKYGPMPISHIGDRISIAKPNMTSIIGKLTNLGLVRRNTSSSDRRVISIELTEEGLEYIDDLTVKVNRILDKKLYKLSQDETRQFVQSIRFLTSIGDKIME